MTGNQTILVVEDDKNVRNLLRNALEEGGYVVREADGAEAALAFLENEKPSLDYA